MYTRYFLVENKRTLDRYEYECNPIRPSPIRFIPIDRPNERSSKWPRRAVPQRTFSQVQEQPTPFLSLHSPQDSAKKINSNKLQAHESRRSLRHAFPSLSSPPSAAKLSKSCLPRMLVKIAAFGQTRAEEVPWLHLLASNTKAALQ